MTAPQDRAVFRRVDDQEHAGPAPGQGPRLVAPGTSTGGEFGLFEVSVAPGTGTPAAHHHATFTESFYVLEGTVRLRVGDEVVDAGPGDFLFVPRGTVHGFTGTSDGAARMLILFTPGVAREAYFREIAALYDRDPQPSREAIDEIARRHDQHNVWEDG